MCDLKKKTFQFIYSHRLENMQISDFFCLTVFRTKQTFMWKPTNTENAPSSWNKRDSLSSLTSSVMFHCSFSQKWTVQFYYFDNFMSFNGWQLVLLFIISGLLVCYNIFLTATGPWVYTETVYLLIKSCSLHGVRVC